MKNVLLVNSSCGTAARMLQERRDIRLSVLTIDKYRHLYDDRTDVECISSVADLTQVRLAALRIRERNPFDYVVSPSEWSIQAGGYLRSYFGLPGIGYDTANRFSNKLVMKQQLAAAGLPVAAFRRLESLQHTERVAAELGWPVVVKRVSGGGAGFVLAVRSPQHLSALLADPDTKAFREAPFPLLAEERVEIEEEFHCDGVIAGGEVRFARVSRYFKPVLSIVGGCRHGSFTLAESDPDAKAVLDLHERVVSALGLQAGVTHLEVFKCAQGFLIGEIACRPGGIGIAPMIRHQYGVDLWDAFLATQLDTPVDITSADRGGHTIQYTLPRPAGTVVAITPVEELQNLPGVVRAEVEAEAGDTMAGPVDASHNAGIVLLHADDEVQIHERIAALDQKFEIRVVAGQT
ncbi:ATP-grasp domain-containing protein [Streptomyces canus]|uniref:ATP-grasp domain-containing protein n=1 Tax=Streptomyces canus TaxID=58343 RepID=UPI002E28BBA6|nr:ATP-grasp domain-containing protein [Streptomyces canus]